MTSGYPSDATENAVQANITAAGYSNSTGGGGTTGALHAVGAGKCLDVPNSTTTRRHPAADLGLQRPAPTRPGRTPPRTS